MRAASAPTRVKGFGRFIVAPAQVRKVRFRSPLLEPSKSSMSIRVAVCSARCEKKQTAAAVLDHSDFVIAPRREGLHVGRNMNGKYSFDFLKIAREMADELQVIRLIAHVGFSPPETPGVMGADESAGDIVNHLLQRRTRSASSRRPIQGKTFMPQPKSKLEARRQGGACAGSSLRRGARGGSFEF